MAQKPSLLKGVDLPMLATTASPWLPYMSSFQRESMLLVRFCAKCVRQTLLQSSAPCCEGGMIALILEMRIR